MQGLHMANRRTHYKACKQCKRSRAECGGLSYRGLCSPCGIAATTQNATDLHHHRGEAFEKWARGYLRTALRYADTVVPTTSSVD